MVIAIFHSANLFFGARIDRRKADIPVQIGLGQACSSVDQVVNSTLSWGDFPPQIGILNGS